MDGILYLVGTPIGNLEDLSKRAIRTLEEVDYILAEDTRVTLRLLKNFSINKQVESYYKDIEEKKKEKIIKDLKKGYKIALVSDAGMPTISDPGAILVNSAIKENIKVTTIPGPSAGITALATSGILDTRYIFYGFLKSTKELQEIMYNKYPTIIYESPNRIRNTLEEINKLDSERYLIVGREITKLYETFYYGTANEILDELKEKGEMVLIIDKASELILKEEDIPFKDVYEYYLKQGLKKNEIIKKIAKDYGLSKNDVYKKFTND